MSYHRQDAGSIGPSLRVHVGRKDDGDGDGDGDVYQHKRPDGSCSLGCHAVAGKVPGHDVQEPRQRRGSCEPKNDNGTRIVDAAEGVAQLVVRQVGKSAPVGASSLLELCRRDKHRRHEARREEIEAHDDDGGHREHLVRVANAAFWSLRVIVPVATHERHHCLRRRAGTLAGHRTRVWLPHC